MTDICFRIGNVSELFPDIGMITVTYPQYDDATTGKLPLLSFTDEYKIPKVGDQVAVLHFPNGPAFAIVLGHYWNEKVLCPEPGEKVWWKTFSPFTDWPTKAYAKYDDEDCTLKVFLPHKVEFIVGPCPEHPDESGEITITAKGKAPKITIRTEGDQTGLINVQAQGGQSGTVNMDAQGASAVINESALGGSAAINASAPGGTIALTDETTTNTGLYTSPKDVIGEGKSLAHHTHAGVHGETAPPS